MSFKYLVNKFGKDITNIIIRYNIEIEKIVFCKVVIVWELDEWIKTYNYFTHDEYEGYICEFNKYYFGKRNKIIGKRISKFINKNMYIKFK